MHANNPSEPLSAQITEDNDFDNLTYTLQTNTEGEDTTLFDEYGVLLGTAVNRNTVTHFSADTSGKEYTELTDTGFWETLYNAFEKTRDYVTLLDGIETDAEALSRNEIEKLFVENTPKLIEYLDTTDYANEWKVELIKSVMSQYAVAFAKHGHRWGVENDRLAVLIGKAWYESNHANNRLPETVHEAMTAHATTEPVETAFTGYESVMIWAEN